MSKHHKRKPRKIIGRMHIPCPQCLGQRTFARFDIFSWHGGIINRLARHLNWQWLEYKKCSLCKGNGYKKW
jgi:hypothetical protein